MEFIIKSKRLKLHHLSSIIINAVVIVLSYVMDGNIHKALGISFIIVTFTVLIWHENANNVRGMKAFAGGLYLVAAAVMSYYLGIESLIYLGIMTASFFTFSTIHKKKNSKSSKNVKELSN
ncbi:MAG: hypothetical protein Kapaf2KO_23240 [Candidatus Kapaibacteriales bacterium]